MARMIDADALQELCNKRIQDTWNSGVAPVSWAAAYADFKDDIDSMPTLTQPNEGGKDKNVPTNEPLTLEELRKIDTVIPLWVHNLSWGQHKPRLMLVRHVTSNYWSCVDFDGFETIKSDDYGSRYLIYRRPPEGEEET